MSHEPISVDVTGDSPQGPPHTVDELQRVVAGQQARMQQLVTVKTEAIEAKKDAVGEQEFAQDLADDTARMQDGERHKYDLLVRLARRSIAEKRVIKEEELKHITDLRWQDAAAATAEQDRLDAQEQNPSPAPAKSPAKPAAVPHPKKQPTLHVAVKRKVKNGEAAINPDGDPLMVTDMQMDQLVWGEFEGDHVWYPGQVVADEQGRMMVRFDDGDEDKHEGLEQREWRHRQPAAEKEQPPAPAEMEPPQKRQRRTSPAVESAVAPPAAAPTAPTAAPPLAAPAAAPATATSSDAPEAVLAASPAPAGAAVWEVWLGGRFTPYEAAEQRELEAAWQRGDTVAHLTLISSTSHVVDLKSPMAQRAANGKSKSRDVRRRTADAEPTPPPPLAPAVASTSATDDAPPAPTAGAPTAAPAAAPTAAEPTAATLSAPTAAGASSRAEWWTDPRRLEEGSQSDDHLPWPKTLDALEELEDKGECPLLLFLVFHSILKNVTQEHLNTNFNKLMESFGSLENIRLAERDATVTKSDQEQTHPKEPRTGKKYHKDGWGVDPARAGMPKRYAKAVVEKALRLGGNGAVRANSIQDLLDNVHAHPRAGGKLSLSFLLESPPDDFLPASDCVGGGIGRKTLHDLTLYQTLDSKVVKHGIDFIKHHKAANGHTRETYRRMRAERLAGGASEVKDEVKDEGMDV